MANNGKISFTITPRADRLIAGSDAIVDLRIENRSADTLEFPNPILAASTQPVYSLKGPDGKEVEFTPRRIGEGEEELAPPAPQLVKLPPQQAWVGDMALNPFADVKRPGAYTISGHLVWHSLNLQSTPGKFEVVEAAFSELAVCLWVDSSGGLVREAMLRQQGKDGPEAVAAVMSETNPILGEMGVVNLIPRGNLPAGTHAICGTYANYESDLLRWTVAQADSGFFVAHNSGPETVILTSKFKSLRPLTPLATRDESLYLLAVADGKKKSELLFTRATSPAGLAKTAPLHHVAAFDPAPVGVSTVLGPESQNSPIVVVAVSIIEEQVSQLVAVHLTHEGESSIEEHPLRGPTPTGTIAGHISDDGQTRIGLIARLPEDPTRLSFVEWRGSLESGCFQDMEMLPSFPEPCDLTDIRILYYEPERGHINRIIVIRCKDGTLKVIDHTGRLREAYTSVPAGAPMGIMPALRTWYVVFVADGIVQAGTL